MRFVRDTNRKYLIAITGQHLFVHLRVSKIYYNCNNGFPEIANFRSKIRLKTTLHKYVSYL